MPIRLDSADPERCQIGREQVPTAVEHGLARAWRTVSPTAVEHARARRSEQCLAGARRAVSPAPGS